MSAVRNGPAAYPLVPLLSAFRAALAATPTPSPLPGAAAVASAAQWLNPAFLDTASPDTFADRVTVFYRDVTPTGWHPEAVHNGRVILRHALIHLLRGTDALPNRIDRCVRPAGAYYVPGLGRAFWAAVVQTLRPDTLPRWLPEVEAGARMVRLLPPQSVDGSATSFAELARVYDRLLAAQPGLTGPNLDHFFVCVARLRGRELTVAPAGDPDPIPTALRGLRNRVPLRRRLADCGRYFGELAARFRTSVAARDFSSVTEIVREIGGGEPSAVAEELLERSDRPPAEVYVVLRERFGAAVASAVVSLLPDAGLVPLTPPAFAALARLDDALVSDLSPDDEFALLQAAVVHLRDRYRVHPLEVPDLLEALTAPDEPEARGGFRGFCSDTFRFLTDLEANNSRGWMDVERDRYQFAVREPIVELCQALADRYVRPVLGGEYGWDMECDPRPGKAVTSIVKNDYGRSAPYQPALWITFYPKAGRTRQQDAQLFVRADPYGLGFGFHLGRSARDAGRRFRQAVQRHAHALFDALAATDAPNAVSFSDGATTKSIKSPEDLRAWAASKTLYAARHLPPDAPLLRADELAGEILLTFDRLVPLVAAAVEPDPLPLLRRRAGRPDGTPTFDRESFLQSTFLPEVWLDRAIGLLSLKRQLVLQGVAGTGKTHVARSLARFLTKDRPDAVRFVQFHPSYSYAEFVEHPVPGPDGSTFRDGVLIEFAAAAARRPAETFVLVIDDMTRGNLPNVFGELLYLLEYRGQAVTLPFSQRPFRLPANLYLVGTVNTADPAAAQLGQPLRRRFGFVEMPPDAALLARWLDVHPPADPDPTFGPRVVRLFEQLNSRVVRDLGPDRQVGHSAFMVPNLDAEKLRAVWDHHVRPMLGPDAGRPDRLSGFDLDRWLATNPPTAPAGQS